MIKKMQTNREKNEKMQTKRKRLKQEVELDKG